MSLGSHNAKLFINYRREDTAPYAGRLYDRLTAHFGADQVFIDIDQIEPGEDFAEAINSKVGACDIAIIFIGRNWLGATDASGKRRLDDNEDFVRMEIVAALQRKIRVIPVLVGGARMPRKQDLPEELAPLSRRNAIELSETRFHADVNRLIEAIEKPRSFPEKKTEPLPGPVAPIAQTAPPVKLPDTENLPKTSAFRPLAAQSAQEVAKRLGLREHFTPSLAQKDPSQPETVREPVKALVGKKKSVLAVALVTLLVTGVVGGWWFGVEQPRKAAERQRQIAEQQQKEQKNNEGGRRDASPAIAPAAQPTATQTGARGMVFIKTEPTGATIMLGEESQQSPAIFTPVKIGTLPLKITLEGYDPVEMAVEVKEGQISNPDVIKLSRSAAAVAAEAKKKEDSPELRKAVPTKVAKGDYPYGIPVPGQRHLVESCYLPGKYIDVEGFPPGTTVKDPYTDKIFVVP